MTPAEEEIDRVPQHRAFLLEEICGHLGPYLGRGAGGGNTMSPDWVSPSSSVPRSVEFSIKLQEERR
jgi:hypothetical protein